MNDYARHYLENLYPFQDGILRLVNACETPFFLTGGTALSRGYLGHRFSDDLDFFVNDDALFYEYIERIRASFVSAGIAEGFEIDPKRFRSFEGYVQLYLKHRLGHNLIELKVEFVNDIAYRVGEPLESRGLGRIDTWENILSNKITALYRFAPKDVADLWAIARSFPFDWKDVFKHVHCKIEGVYPEDVSEVFRTVPSGVFDGLAWAPSCDWSSIHSDLAIMAEDILLGRSNSLRM